MTDFDVVDVSGTVPPTVAGLANRDAAESAVVGKINGRAVAASIEQLRNDLTPINQSGDGGLQLSQLVIKLAVGVEGGVAFIAKGSAEASIEVTFAPRK